MISAAGSPNCSSPFSRSSCESRLKSWSSARSPAIETSNAASSFAASSSSITAGGVVVVEDRDRDDRRVAVRPRRAAVLGSVEVRARPRRAPARRSRRASRPTNASNSGESTVCCVGADDDDVGGDALRIGRERPSDGVDRALRLRVVRRRALGREAVAEERRRSPRSRGRRWRSTRRSSSTDAGRWPWRGSGSRASRCLLPRSTGLRGLELVDDLGCRSFDRALLRRDEQRQQRAGTRRRPHRPRSRARDRR